MTRDYRKGTPPPRRRTERRGTCAFSFLVGLVVGGFGVGIAWLKQAPPPSLAGWLTPPAETAAVAAVVPPRQPPPKPNFDFYSLLPEEKVVVPADTPPAPVQLPPPGARPQAVPPPAVPADAAVANAPLPAPATSGGYVLQVGAFKRSEDAEKRKAELALLGVETTIQTTTAENGQTYYRVRTGNYEKSAANLVRERLKRSGHDSMMMKAQ